MKQVIQKFYEIKKNEKQENKLTDHDKLIEDEKEKDSINSLEKILIKLDFSEKITKFETVAFETVLLGSFVNIIQKIIKNVEGVEPQWEGDFNTTNKFIEFKIKLNDKKNEEDDTKLLWKHRKP